MNEQLERDTATCEGHIVNRLAILLPGSTFAVLIAAHAGHDTTTDQASFVEGHVVGAGMIIAVDLMDNRLEYAKQFGATHTVNPGRQGREAWAT